MLHSKIHFFNLFFNIIRLQYQIHYKHSKYSKQCLYLILSNYLATPADCIRLERQATDDHEVNKNPQSPDVNVGSIVTGVVE